MAPHLQSDCNAVLPQNRNSGSTSMAQANLLSRLLLNTFSIGTSLRLHLRGERWKYRCECVGNGGGVQRCPASSFHRTRAVHSQWAMAMQAVVHAHTLLHGSTLSSSTVVHSPPLTRPL